jgi:polysaccharide biosynthesis protein PslH
MNILFLTQVLPYPLDAGPKIRAYYVLRHLADSGHRITLISFIREDDRPEYLEHLRPYCSRIHTVPLRRSRTRDALAWARALASRSPFLVSRDQVSSMTGIIKRIARGSPRFDAIHADQLWMAPYALLARRAAPPGSSPSIVLDQHNAVFNIPRRLAATETSSWRRALLNMEAKKLARYEKNICRGFDRVVWVTDQDRRVLFKEPANTPIDPGSQVVIPIALDLARHAPLSRRDHARRVTFMGGLHWPPNADGIRWFQREIWPAIRRQMPSAVLTIIGKDPHQRFWDCRDPSIEATGYIPDPISYLEETAVFIVPLLAGGGMRVKILDAWSWALPVVSTRIGAEGIRTRHGEDIYLADEPAAFASAVIEVMKNPVLAAHLAGGGRQTLELYHDWRKAYQAWDQIYPCESYSLSPTRPA